MTPLPKPSPYSPRPDNPIPMTSAQYLRWRARKARRYPPMTLPTKEEAAAAIEKLQGAPYWRDVVCAVDGAVAGATASALDEVDAGYLAAVRIEPRVVGTADGQVPMEVARRLYFGGLIRKVDSPAC